MACIYRMKLSIEYDDVLLFAGKDVVFMLCMCVRFMVVCFIHNDKLEKCDISRLVSSRGIGKDRLADQVQVGTSLNLCFGCEYLQFQ